MNGLPKDFDLSPLVGAEIELVCFGANTVFIHLSGGAAMFSIYSSVTLNGRSADCAKPTECAGLIGLVGEAVAEAAVAGRGDIVLTLSSGSQLAVHDDQPNYESYSLTIAGDETYV